MAQQLKPISLSSPGFLGLNTQDSPIGIDPAFASRADNCIIDKSGRVAARKGFAYITTDATPLGSSDGIEAVHEHVKSDGTKIVFSAGNNKIFSGTTTLTDITPASYTITANNWKILSFNGFCYFFQRGYEPLAYSDSTGNLTVMSSVSGATGTPPEANEALAAWGRLFVADIASDKSTIYWSDLLLGAQWSGGSSGSIDITKHWPNGYDEITALAAHNDFLIVFGKVSMLVFAGAESPSSMTLSDTVSSIGCMDRDTVQNIGTDLLFLSRAGVRSLMRTIQEKSAPLRDVSKNVRTDLIALLEDETSPIKSLYSQENAFYLLSFRDAETVYCFDTRAPLQDGSFRVTTWSNIEPLAFTRAEDGTIYLGHPEGISQYTGYQDNGLAYSLAYFTHDLDFGNPANLKFLKRLEVTIIGGQQTAVNLKWGYDYTENYYSQSFALASRNVAEYGVGEYNIAEYTASVVTNVPGVNGAGSGKVIKVGVETTVNGYKFSVQKIDILALLGRLI